MKAHPISNPPLLPGGAFFTHSERKWYVIATLLSLAAIGLTWAVPLLHAKTPTALLLVAVVVSALYGGLGPAVLATAVCATALNFAFMPPRRYGFLPEAASELVSLGVFVGLAVVVSTLGNRRWRAEAVVRQREHYFRLLIENTSDILTILGADGTIRYESPSIQRVLGYAPDELLGRNIFEFIHPDDLPGVQEFYRRQLTIQGVAPALEVRFRTRDGGWRVLESIGNNLLHEPSVAGIVVHSRDITERRELAREQAARREAEAAHKRFHDLVEGLDAIVWEAEAATGRIIFVSNRLQTMLGYSGSEWLESADGWLRHVYVEDRDAVLEVLRSGSAEPREIEYRAISANGRLLWLRMTVRETGAGNARQLRGLIVDATDRHQAEAALRLSERLAATGRLAASIAHEINNPMAAVTNLAFLLEQHPTLDPTARQYARMAQEELRRMAHITRQMLAFYRDTSAPIPTDIPEVLDSVLHLYERRLAISGVTVERKFEAVPRVEVFPGELRQVFSNLLLNAADAASPGGRIRVHVYCSRDWHNGARPGVRIVVADTGRGIAREHQQRIFEPFFTTKGQKGTGLGLWVTHGIVQKHGGTIRVRSSNRAGQSGTCFSIFLPIPFARAQSAPAGAGSAA